MYKSWAFGIMGRRQIAAFATGNGPAIFCIEELGVWDGVLVYNL